MDSSCDYGVCISLTIHYLKYFRKRKFKFPVMRAEK